MIISPGRNYIFVHIPKTGGTSMALALEARAMKDDLMLGDTPKALKRRRRLKGASSRGRLWKHSTLADIDGVVSRDQIEAMFVFTMVRNPWDRMVSYYHWLKDQTFDHSAVRLARELPFGDFIAHPQTRASLQASPARHYVTPHNSAEHCQAFIRLDHLEEDLAPVEAHLGFGLNLAKSNMSDRHADWRSYFDEKSAQIICEDCAEDIERFGFSF